MVNREGERPNFGDFDKSDKGLAIQRKVIAATEALKLYLKKMEEVYDVSLLYTQGDVTEAQDVYLRVKDEHLKRMMPPLNEPWLRKGRG